MGKYIENTMEGFKKAVSIGAGIESDIQVTRDNELVCFHDYSFKIKGQWYDIAKLSFEELKELKFNDKRIIPKTSELFLTFKNIDSNLRYSFDIRNKKVGLKLIDMILDYELSKQVEITERKLPVLAYLRDYHKHINLVHTLQEKIKNINHKNVNFDLLKDLEINTINIVSWRATPENINNIIDNDFNCYVWGVNRKTKMKKLINYRYKNRHIKAIYTDFPNISLNILKGIR